MPALSTPPRHPKARLLLSLSAIAFLAACGGGEEGGTDLSSYLPDFAAPNPVDIAVLLDDFLLDPNWEANLAGLLASQKYLRTAAGLSWIQSFEPGLPNSATNDPLRTSGAAFAHANGITGLGQIIAFSDNHVSEDHEAIGDARLEVLSNGSSGEHGTSVVSVAIGDSANFVGTAPGATGIYGSFDFTSDLTAVGVAALAQGAVAWNNSWGYTNIGLNQSGFDAAFAGTDGAAYLTAIRNYVYLGDGVVVFAVDNDDTGNAGLMDGLPVLENALEAGWIAVANGVPTIDGLGNVLSVYLLSSACYESARWCIVADGSWNAATGSGSAYADTTGSSFATPQVSGALALLAEAFPTLSPQELRIRLLASAEDDFFTGDDTVELADGYFKRYSVLYGHGYLDIEAALLPIGPTAMAMAAGQSVNTDAPVLVTGRSLGDAVEMSLTGTDVAVSDVLGAPFRMTGTALATGSDLGSQGPVLLAKSMAANLAADRKSASTAVNDPFAAFLGPILRLEDPDGLGRATVLLPQPGSSSAGVAVSRALGDGDTRFELGLKIARDDGSLMSLGGDQAASMASVTLGLTQDLGATGFLALSGEIGVTDLGGATDLTRATTASFNAVKLTAGTGDLFAKGDRFSVGVGLPIAIASGRAVTTLPVLREGAAMVYEDVTLDLAPDDRQVDFEMTYMAPLAERVEMKLSLVHSENYGNRAGQTDTSGAIAFAFKF